MPTQLERHRILAGATRGRILDALRRSDVPRGVQGLASELGLHPNSVREQLHRLVGAGMVEVRTSDRAGRGRPALLYCARPATEAPDGDHYRALARVLVEQVASHPAAREAAIEAGERWGRALAQANGAGATSTPGPDDAVDGLALLLDETGFAPEPPSGAGAPIRLRACPYPDLARERGEVVCGIHLGLMRGALRARRASVDVVALEPFVEPDLCLAHLGDLPRD